MNVGHVQGEDEGRAIPGLVHLSDSETKKSITDLGFVFSSLVWASGVPDGYEQIFDIGEPGLRSSVTVKSWLELPQHITCAYCLQKHRQGLALAILLVILPSRRLSLPQLLASLTVAVQ